MSYGFSPDVRRTFLFAAALFVAVVFLLGFSARAYAADLYVDNTNPSCDDGTGSPAYCHIQNAIDAAAAGDTIHVAAGDYYENDASWRDLLIDKSLTLKGAGSASTIVHLTSTKTNGVEIDGANLDVTLEGIAFKGSAAPSTGPDFALRIGGLGGGFNSLTLRDVDVSYASGRNVLLEAASTFNNVTIENSKFHHAGSWGFTFAGQTTGVTITNSDFTDNGSVDEYHGIGLDFSHPNISNVTVTGGHFDRNTAKGINIQGLSNATFDGITASNNTGSPGVGDRVGLNIYEWGSATSNVTIQNSTMTLNGRWGIAIGGDSGYPVSNILIKSSVLGSNNWSGLNIWNGGGGVFSGIVLHHNRIVGNGAGITGNESGIVAENNWWACNGGPGAAGCQTITAPGVDYNPWVVMNITDLAAEFAVGETAIFTADLTRNSNGADTSGDGYIPPGNTVAFTPVADVSPANGVVANGKAQTTFTAPNTLGPVNVCAKYNQQTSCDTVVVAAPCTTDCYVDAALGNDANLGNPASPKKTIQAGIDSVQAGGTVHVRPGAYDETASGRALYNGGSYQFGLFIDKDGITLQGVDGSDAPVSGPNAVLASIETNATNNFGYSGVFVQGNNVTIDGLKFLDNDADNNPSTDDNNKTIEVIGDNFAFRDSVIDVSSGGSLYINDWRYAAGPPESCIVNKYTVENNIFKKGASLDVSSGVGACTAASDRVIQNNEFEAGTGQFWPQISFNGTVPSVGWFVFPVGGAVITGNSFQATDQYIRTRGIVDDNFDWASYFAGNTFPKAVIALESVVPFKPRAFSYTSGSYTYDPVYRIGTSIQPEIDIAHPGDTVLVKDGTYPENLTINKNLSLIGENQAGTIIDATAIDGVQALDVSAGNVVLKNFTLKGHPSSCSNNTCRGIKIGGAGNSATIENVTVKDAYRAQIDLNGQTGVLIKNVTATGSDWGAGLIMSNVEDVLVDGLTTSGNAWGGVTISSSGAGAPSHFTKNVVFQGTLSLGEPNPIFVELNYMSSSDSYPPVLQVTVPGFAWAVTNYRFGTGEKQWLLYPTQAGAAGAPPDANADRGIPSELHWPASFYYPPSSIVIDDASVDLDSGVFNFPVPIRFVASSAPVNSLQFDIDWPACLSVDPTSGVASPLTGGFGVSYAPTPGDATSTRVVVAPPVGPPFPTILTGAILSLPFKYTVGGGCDGVGDKVFTFTPINQVCGATDGVTEIACTVDAGVYTVDFNEAPTAINLTPNTVAENQPANTSVGALSATEPDGDPVTYSESSACVGSFDNSAFQLSGANVATSMPLDHEATPTIGYCVEANDGRGGTFVQIVTITVTDLNDAPTDITLTPSTVNENEPVDTLVGTLDAIDQDVGDTHIFTLVSGTGDTDNASFTIVGDQLKTNAVFDHETQPTLSIRVRATDLGGLWVEKQLTITVLNVNEAPVCGSLDNSSVAENAPYSGNVTCTDVDGDSLTYTLTTGCSEQGANPLSNDFNISAGGYLTAPAADFELGVKNSRWVCVQAKDPSNAVGKKAFLITLTNVLDVSYGDCNVSGSVNATDLSATVLEIYDNGTVAQGGTDDTNADWLTAPYGTFRGSPEGCNSNHSIDGTSLVVNAADLSCTVNLIFGQSCTAMTVASAQPAFVSVPADRAADGSVTVSLEAEGHPVAAVAFTLKLDPSVAYKDITYAVPESLLTMAIYDAEKHAVQVVVAGVSLPLPALDGAIATIALEGAGSVHLENVSAGNTSGMDVPVMVKVGDSMQFFRNFLPTVTH